jgi:hypothetical protein
MPLVHHYIYNLFGLTIASEREFLELIPSSAKNAIDVYIRFGKVDMPDVKVKEETAFLQLLKQDYYFLKLESFARFLVIHDETTMITIDVIDEAKYSYVKSWLFGSVFSAVLHMNNRFALHASAVKTQDGEVVLFCGRSGIGKSTIATRLNNKGFDIVSDDKAVLSLKKDDDSIYIEPSIQITRLWNDSYDKLGDDGFLENPESVSLNEEKFQFLIKKENRILSPLKVKAIYIIRQIKEDSQLQLRRINGKLKHQRLKEQIHRKQFIPKLKKQREHWQYLHDIATRIPVTALLRPLKTSHEDFTSYVVKEITKQS